MLADVHVIMLFACLGVAKAARVLLVAASNVICCAGPTALAVAALQHIGTINTALDNTLLLYVGLCCSAVALLRVLILRRLLRWQWRRGLAQAARQRRFAAARVRPADWMVPAGEGVVSPQHPHGKDVLAEMRRDWNQLVDLYWGRWWQMAHFGLLGCGLAAIPYEGVTTSLLALWCRRQHTPEFLLAVTPFAAMVGVSALPSWWWAVALLPVAFCLLLMAATLKATVDLCRGNRERSSWMYTDVSWLTAFWEATKLRHIWGKWRSLPQVYFFLVPLGLVLWTGFGLLQRISTLLGTEWTITAAALATVLTIGCYAPPAYLLRMLAGYYMKRLEAAVPAGRYAQVS